jgi:hypothetical protein
MDKSQQSDAVAYAQFFPNIAYVRVQPADGGDAWMYSIIADRAYEAHNVVFAENLTRLPAEDKLTLYHGLVGAYPNVFLDVAAAQVPEFVAAVSGLQSADDFTHLVQKWGIARNSSRFWPFFDWLHQWKTVSRPENDPDEQGIVDLSQYLYFAQTVGGT